VKGDLDQRLTALDEAAHLAEGRLDDSAVGRARAVVAQAGERLGLGLESTVVALAGPTGAGKSRLFNALAGEELAAVGRRRPTTSAGQAAVWGDGDGADPLLDWLEIPRRHRLAADGLDGLVLVDLPDFDSVETAHRLEVDRIVGLADLIAWVVDPQKYADAALHDRYLRPLASHAEAMAVVLNQADLLSPSDVDAWRADAVRLLVEDGVRGADVVVVSAETGAGLDELRRLLAERVRARDAAVARLAADVDDAVEALAAACGDGSAGGIRGNDRSRLTAALEDAAGVPAVLRAVDRAHRRRGALETGWPFVRWVLRLRPDPLRRLRLRDTPSPAVRSSLPPPTDVQVAQIATAARRVADGAAESLPEPWPRLVREAATAQGEQIADRLDQAVSGADLHIKRPRWWSAAAVGQRMLVFAVLAGVVWLLGLAVLGYLRADEIVPLPEVYGLPVPTWLLMGGAAAGIAVAFVARLANAVGARRRARAAARSLRARVEEVGHELVVAPVEAELDARRRLCEAVARARRRGRRRR
jgi:GTP-binding protein EngB required for normal cell division